MINPDLIAKYLAGEASETEKNEVERWLDADPANRTTLSNLKKAMRPEYSKMDFKETLEVDWLSLQGRIQQRQTRETVERSTPAWLKIAASALIFIVAGLGSWYTVKNLSDTSHEIVSADTVKHITLPDGTDVWMNSNTTISVDGDFGEGERKIALSGEAYFEVSKDKNNPFIITSGEITTRVVGTSFQVSHQMGESVNVTVTEGKVLVARAGLSSVLLETGEIAVYDVVSETLRKDENEDLNFLAWQTGIIRFRAESLKEVCAFLRRHYKADVRLVDSALAQKKVTTVFDHVNVDEALSILSATLDLKITRRDSTIYLSQ